MSETCKPESSVAVRRHLFKLGLAAGATALAQPLLPSQVVQAAEPGDASPDAGVRSGAIGFTSFIHPTAQINTQSFSIGAQSLIEGFVRLEGASARLGHASNLQDNDRLLNYQAGARSTPGDLIIGDGSFTAHGVTFIGKVRIGDASGTVIRAVVQNARVGHASLTGFTAHILGNNPARLIDIPDASLVLFGARIRSQADVAANIIPIPAAFSLFAADVDQENLVLARGYNLLYRAASRSLPFSADPASPGNPGVDFPTLAQAFGNLAVAPPTVDRRGTGPIPARQASLGDLGFTVFPPSPIGAPFTPFPPGPAPSSGEAGARFIRPSVVHPELVDLHAVVLGGVTLAAGVRIGAGSYLHGGDAPAISVGADTTIGLNTSVHELTYTSVRIGKNVTIGNNVVLHGPLEIGDNVTIDDGAVLFGPSVAAGVTVGANALVFGPVSVTRDVPAGTIIVPAGNEGLIAPSHNAAQAALALGGATLAQWRRAGAAGATCSCGAGSFLHACS